MAFPASPLIVQYAGTGEPFPMSARPAIQRGGLVQGESAGLIVNSVSVRTAGMKTLLALLALALSPLCHAQRQLWTWSPPASESEFRLAVHTAATDSSGNTAVVIGEENRTFNSGRYLIVWIGARGNTIHQATFETADDSDKLSGIKPREKPWVVGTVSATMLTVSDGTTLRLFKVQGRNVITSTVDLTAGPEDSVDVIFSGAPPVFPGWLKLRSAKDGQTFTSQGASYFYDFKELSAWLPR